MNRFLSICLTILFFNCSLLAQVPVDWHTLADVTFEEKKDVAEDLPYNKATFGPIISLFKDKEVIVSGYMIPMDAMGISYALSKNPNAVCFFCGGAGPETVIQLNLTQIKRYRTDDRLTFKGTLQMNEEDIYSLTYVLNNAEEL